MAEKFREMLEVVLKEKNKESFFPIEIHITELDQNSGIFAVFEGVSWTIYYNAQRYGSASASFVILDQERGIGMVKITFESSEEANEYVKAEGLFQKN